MHCRGSCRVTPKIRNHGMSSWWTSHRGSPAGDHFVWLGTESVFVVVDVKTRLTILRRFPTITSTVQVQSSVERVFNEYHPIGQQMLMQTASRMAASVLAIHNKVRREKGLGALPLVSMGGFARDILEYQAGKSTPVQLCSYYIFMACLCGKFSD